MLPHSVYPSNEANRYFILYSPPLPVTKLQENSWKCKLYGNEFQRCFQGQKGNNLQWRVALPKIGHPISGKLVWIKIPPFSGIGFHLICERQLLSRAFSGKSSHNIRPNKYPPFPRKMGTPTRTQQCLRVGEQAGVCPCLLVFMAVLTIERSYVDFVLIDEAKMFKINS